MKLRIRRILSAVLVLAMVVSFLPTFDLSVKASAATPAAEPTEAVFDFVADISHYRGKTEAHTANNNGKFSKTSVYTDYPAKQGYVFAGWFTDTVNQTPLSSGVKNGSAYAKFVPERLMKAVAQVSITTDYTTASSAMRFVAAVDSLNYNQVGFLLNKEGSSKTYTHGAVVVYTSLSAALEGGSLTPGYFHKTGSHMFSLTVTGIKDQADNYKATPFWITLDGTKVDHIQTSNKAVEMGVAANVAAGRTEVPAEKAWYKNSASTLYISNAAEFAAFAEMSKTNNFAGKTVKLTGDITFNPGVAGDKMIGTGSGLPYLEGVEATPTVGSTSVPFAGTFDGQGHTISGMVDKVTGYASVFSAIKDATIRNVKVSRSTFRGGSGGGVSAGLVAATYGTSTIENVVVGKDVNLWAASNQGGVVGYNHGVLTINNAYCSAYFNPQWTANVYAGGIVGLNENTATVKLNLTNTHFDGVMNGTAQGSSFVGGLVGCTQPNPVSTLSASLVTGSVGVVTSTGTLYIGSVIASKSWTGSKTVTSGVYATKAANAQLIRPDQSFTAGTVTQVDTATTSINGTDAFTNLSGLFTADAWSAQRNASPVLKFMATSDDIDISWYDANKTEYVITTAAQLNGLAYLSATNTFAGKTVKLGADIVMNEGDASTWGTTPPAIAWTPIGDSADGFKGTFDGQGHTVSGLYFNGAGYATFIARMYAGAVLKNVRIVNSYFVSTGGDSFHNGAGIVGRMTGGCPISDVYTDAFFKGVKGVGIIGFSDSGAVNMTNCWFDGTIDVTGATNVGGMVSSVVNNVVHSFTNCLFTGTMTGTAGSSAYIGGIYGIGPYGATIKLTNSLVAGDMTAITAGKTGAITGNNPGGNKSSHSNVFVTSETHTAVAGAGGTLSNFKYTAVAESAILGDDARSVLTGFDFVKVWGTRKNDVPKLGNDQMDWYDANATEYILYDAEDLYGFSILQETVNFKDKTVKLGADIILNEGDAKTWATTAPANMWNPIGKSDASLSFEGTFDGQGHTISGLYYTSANYGGGLFTFTGANAVIKDLKLTNSYIKSTYGTEWSATGSVAAFVNGTDFVNVYTDAIIDTNSGYTGGIGGRVQGNAITVDGCEFAGTVTATGTAGNYIGGLMGGFNGNTAGASVIRNSKVTGTVSGANIYVGGITGVAAGPANASLTIENCAVPGAITGTVGISGGFIGRVNAMNTTINNSTFTGTVNGGTKLGGFVGQTNTAGYTTTIQNSTFDGTITATNTSESIVSGLVAHMNNGNVTVQDCTAKGTLVAPGPYAAGGIAQIMNVAGVTVNIDGAVVTTDVQCASSNAGGIIGRIMGTNPKVAITNSFANATFSTDSWCTAQVIAHAQNNAATLTNVVYCVPEGSPAAANPVESNGGNVTRNYIKLTNALQINSAYELYMAGMRPDFTGVVSTNTISDAADYYGFMLKSFVDTFSGKTITLAGDITLNEGDATKWGMNAPKYNAYPIGGAASFAGVFDGQGYTISGLYMAFPSGNSMGMFREVTGKVTNFRVENAYLGNKSETDYGYNGGIVSILNGGTVSRVYSNAIVETVDSLAGGLVGYTTGTAATVTECEFDGKLIARCSLHSGCDKSTNYRGHARYVGGIVGGLLATTNNITDCIVSGSVYNEDRGSARIGGIAGGAPEAGKSITIRNCFTLVKFHTMGHTGNNSHFNMIVDSRGEDGVVTRPTNVSTLCKENYMLSAKAYQADGVTTINSNTVVNASNSSGTTNLRYTREAMVQKIRDDVIAGTCSLDFSKVWVYQANDLPVLRWATTIRAAMPYHLTVDGEQIFCLAISGLSLDTYKDAKLTETLLEGQTTSSGSQLYSLAYEYPAAVDFQDIDYADGAYITKYKKAKLTDYDWYISELQAYGFQIVASNIVNTDDAYYTALTLGEHSYSVTFFANTGELYITVSNRMNISPYMNKDYYVTADDNDPKKTTYNDITVTMVELTNGGLCQIIRLKNGHYIVIDGGTKSSFKMNADGTVATDENGKQIIYDDRRELAAALGATADRYIAGDTKNPQVIVDAWIFTHDHADHIGWIQGGVYGAMQVDVYVKGFYYNFTDDFRVETDVKVGTDASGNGVYVPGYANQFYAYEDSKGVGGTNRYSKALLDTSNFWVEYTTTHKMANNVNTPAWGQKGIPIYRLQAGQKYYFDGVTMEVPYTQDQVQPSDYAMDINGSCAWLLFTDDHGNTYLEAGDAEEHNQDEVIELYDDYYDGGTGPNYALFGADLVNAFHHGLNMQIKGDNDYTRQNILFGIQNSDGNPATANTATNANDGRTKFIFYTRGYLNSLFGYISDKTNWNSRMHRGNHYLTAYVYPSLITNSLNAAKAYPNLKSPIAFAAYAGKKDEKGISWQGTTVVSFSASGISWDKQQTTSIYP